MCSTSLAYVATYVQHFFSICGHICMRRSSSVNIYTVIWATSTWSTKKTAQQTHELCHQFYVSTLLLVNFLILFNISYFVQYIIFFSSIYHVLFNISCFVQYIIFCSIYHILFNISYFFQYIIFFFNISYST